MPTKAKILSIAIGVGAVLGTLAFLGFTPFLQHSEKTIIEQIVGASPAGTTFNTAKTAMIVWTPSTTAATSTSILNGDANARIIKQLQFSCTGVGVLNSLPNIASWNLKAATTSASSLGLGAQAPFILDTNVATTSSQVYLATTTPGQLGIAAFRSWDSGTYLTFLANSSSTATCTIGVDYFGT